MPKIVLNSLMFFFVFSFISNSPQKNIFKNIRNETNFNANSFILRYLLKLPDIQSLNKIQMFIGNSNDNQLVTVNTLGELFLEGDNNASSRHFYALKSNGRPYFYEYNNYYSSKIISVNSSDIYRSHSEIINIHFNQSYYYLLSISRESIELADLINEKIYFNNITDVFPSIYFSYNSLINIEIGKNIFLFAYINSLYQLSISTFKLNIFNDSVSYKVLATNYINSSVDFFVSCFSLSENIIECQYLNSYYYVNVSIYNSTTLELLKDNLIGYYSRYACEIFKAIYFKNLVGVHTYDLFIRFLELNITDYTYKNYIPDITELDINEKGNFLCSNYSIGDLIKISDKRIAIEIGCYSDGYYGSEEIIAIALLELYNNDKNILIKYYIIPIDNGDDNSFFTSIFGRFSGFEFKNFLGVAKEIWNNGYCVFLVSYINSSDSIPESINNNLNYEIILNDYINSSLIENNLFGYIHIGYKIISLDNLNDNYIYPISTLTKSKIYIKMISYI